MHGSIETIFFRFPCHRRQFQRFVRQGHVRRVIEQMSDEVEPSSPLIVEIDRNPGRVPGVRRLRLGIQCKRCVSVAQTPSTRAKGALAAYYPGFMAIYTKSSPRRTSKRTLLLRYTRPSAAQ